MYKIHISHVDDKKINFRCTDLTEKEAIKALLNVKSCLYSVGIYDDEDDCVEFYNGEEYLKLKGY